MPTAKDKNPKINFVNITRIYLLLFKFASRIRDRKTLRVKLMLNLTIFQKKTSH